MKNIKKISSWQAMTDKWKKGLYTSPGRPSLSEQKIYRKCIKAVIKNKKNARALVLGSTPELRDILAELKVETIICDISYEMMLAMSEVIKKAKPEKEIWIKAPWEENPLPEKYFDIIVGDLVLGNVPWQVKKKFIPKEFLAKYHPIYVLKNNKL